MEKDKHRKQEKEDKKKEKENKIREGYRKRRQGSDESENEPNRPMKREKVGQREGKNKVTETETLCRPRSRSGQ